MSAPTPSWWKKFYADERAGLDLDAIVRSAPIVELPTNGALIFPHTRLTASGSIVAAVARAAAHARKEILAIGVLHGSPSGIARGIHADVPDEFSLDGFRALYARACAIDGLEPMRIHSRYPFDAADPTQLDLTELRALSKTCAIVATTDPIHHGIGYQTIEAKPETEAGPYAHEAIGAQLDALSRSDWPGFQACCARDRSDFKNAGPVLAMLVPSLRWSIDDLTLVDYADVFGCARPTWVAGARIRLRPPTQS